MQPVASSLEKEDMQAIAEYFSKQTVARPRPAAVAKGSCGAGFSADRSVGCTGCHLDHFQGTAPYRDWPARAGNT